MTATAGIIVVLTAFLPTLPRGGAANSAAGSAPAGNAVLSWHVVASYPSPVAGLRSVVCPTTRHCEAIADPVPVGQPDEGGYPLLPASTATPETFVYGSTDGGSTWARQYSSPPGLLLRALSCRSASDCEAIALRSDGTFGLPDNSDAPGLVLGTHDGGATWVEQARLAATPQAISCPGARNCVIATTASFFRTTDGGATWAGVSAGPQPTLSRSNTELGTSLSDLSCATVSSCVALGAVAGPGPYQVTDYSWATSDGGSQWVRRSAPLGDGAHLACPSPTFCLAVSAPARFSQTTIVLEKTTNGGASWSALRAPAFRSDVPIAVNVACTSLLRCVVANYGDWLPATSPPGEPNAPAALELARTDDGGRGWTQSTVLLPVHNALPDPHWIVDISCAGDDSCIASGGFEVRTTDGGARWTSVSPPPPVLVSSLSCSSSGLCVGDGNDAGPLGGGGSVVVSRDGGRSWPSPLPVDDAALGALSCRGSSACQVLDLYGRVARLDVGARGSGAVLSFEAIPASQQVIGLSCGSPSTCLGISQHASSALPGPPSEVLVTSDGGRRWLRSLARGDLAGVQLVVAVSCPTASTCYVLGSFVNGYASGPFLAVTYDGGATFAMRTVPPDLNVEAMSCVSASSCEAIAGTDSGPVLQSTDDGARSWTARPVPGVLGSSSDGQLACVAVERCDVTSDLVGRAGSGTQVILATSDGGSSWTTQRLPAGVLVVAIACQSDGSCIAAGVDPASWTTVLLDAR